MPLNPDLLRGNLALILLTILEREAMYGFQIIQEAQARTDGLFDFKEGSLYPALHSLVQAGLLTTELREPGRNGQPRKYYLITGKGKTALVEKQAEWRQFTNAINALRGA